IQYTGTLKSTRTSLSELSMDNETPGDEGDTVAHGDFIQTVTSTNCPTTRTMVVDARDNHTYWVQKLADGKCWMLTNLAYAGGGTNTYGDVRSISDGTAAVATFTEAMYYVQANSNPTTNPTEPSTANDGGANGPQYGYLYNWCAAMGAPIASDPNPSSACSNSTTPAVDTTRTICPAGWRLPTGEPTTGEFTALNTAINSGLTNTDEGLRSTWLSQRSGYWVNSYSGVGVHSLLWSSSLSSSTPHYISFSASSVSLAPTNAKYYGFAVRCVAT
ncbi:MAG TPA: FISUMP domain-containing protein, partial [Candidatus Saccharibacteria bacterium]|nr:FISUMP domain-containing protein [Candidatus Saccharibacteria bacterium]